MGEVNEIYNIGTTQELSVMEVATILVEEMTDDKTLDNHIIFVGDRPFNDFRYMVDASLLKSIGWTEEYTDFRTNIRGLIADARRKYVPSSMP
jgi:dTDP-D-glucose 4,6-dehydratase